MRYVQIILLMICLIIIGGCAQQQDTIGTDESIVTQEKISEPEIKEPKRGADPIVAELKANAQKRTKSVRYYLRKGKLTEETGDQYHVLQSNDKYKIVLQKNLIENVGNYDVIYVDRNAQIADAACEFLDSFICSSNKEETIDVVYNQYTTKTPFDWLYELDNGKFVRDTSVGNNKVKMVSFTQNGVSYNGWFDAFYGIPLRIESTDGSEIIFFEKMGYNAVKPDQVTLS